MDFTVRNGLRASLMLLIWVIVWAIPASTSALIYEQQYGRNGDPALPPPDGEQDLFDEQLFGDFKWTYVMFAQREYAFLYDRQPNIIYSLELVNSTDKVWNIVAEVETLNEGGIEWGFVGLGSVDQPTHIRPHSMHTVFLKVHAQDAHTDVIEGRLKLYSDRRQIDDVPIRLERRKNNPHINVDLKPHGSVVDVMVNNVGEPIGDLEIITDGLETYPELGKWHLGRWEQIQFSVRKLTNSARLVIKSGDIILYSNADWQNPILNPPKGVIQRKWQGLYHIGAYQYTHQFQIPNVVWEKVTPPITANLWASLNRQSLVKLVNHADNTELYRSHYTFPADYPWIVTPDFNKMTFWPLHEGDATIPKIKPSEFPIVLSGDEGIKTNVQRAWLRIIISPIEDVELIRRGTVDVKVNGEKVATIFSPYTGMGILIPLHPIQIHPDGVLVELIPNGIREANGLFVRQVDLVVGMAERESTTDILESMGYFGSGTQSLIGVLPGDLRPIDMGNEGPLSFNMRGIAIGGSSIDVPMNWKAGDATFNHPENGMYLATLPDDSHAYRLNWTVNGTWDRTLGTHVELGLDYPMRWTKQNDTPQAEITDIDHYFLTLDGVQDLMYRYQNDIRIVRPSWRSDYRTGSMRCGYYGEREHICHEWW